MNNMSHALFGWSPLLIFPSRVRFVFFVESNIHPLTSLCFGWWVFWHIYQFTFSVGHLLYALTGIPGVPSFYSLLWLFVPCGVRFSWVEMCLLGPPQMFGWLISLTLIPVLDIHSSWVCYPYTGNTSILWCFLSGVSYCFSQGSACVFPMDVLPLEFSFPQCESFTPQWGFQSVFFSPNQSRVLIHAYSFPVTIPN